MADLNSALTLIDERRVIGHLITGFLRKVRIPSLFVCLSVCFVCCLSQRRFIFEHSVFLPFKSFNRYPAFNLMLF